MRPLALAPFPSLNVLWNMTDVFFVLAMIFEIDQFFLLGIWNFFTYILVSYADFYQSCLALGLLSHCRLNNTSFYHILCVGTIKHSTESWNGHFAVSFAVYRTIERSLNSYLFRPLYVIFSILYVMCFSMIGSSK